MRTKSYKNYKTNYSFERTDEGRIYIHRIPEVGGWDYVEFFANVATAIVLVYWMAGTLGQLHPIFNNVIMGGIVGLCLMVWQNDSVIRWPLRFVVWSIFWGLYYFV